jgi:hypothetical protein
MGEEASDGRAESGEQVIDERGARKSVDVEQGGTRVSLMEREGRSHQRTYSSWKE